jgi:hypothetical protein
VAVGGSVVVNPGTNFIIIREALDHDRRRKGGRFPTSGDMSSVRLPIMSIDFGSQCVVRSAVALYPLIIWREVSAFTMVVVRVLFAAHPSLWQRGRFSVIAACLLQRPLFLC